MASSPRTRPTARRTLLVWLVKLAISIGLLSVILTIIPFTEIATGLRSADPGWVFAALLLASGTLALSAGQIAFLLGAVGVSLPVRRILRINLVTEFYGLFVPGYFAGGVLRWYRLTHAGSPPAHTLVVVVFNRLLETTIIALLGCVFWWADPPPRLPGALPITLGVVALALLVANFVVVDRRVAGWIRRRLDVADAGAPGRIRQKLIELVRAVEEFAGIPRRALVWVVFLALVRNALGVYMFYCMALALALPISIVNTGFARSVVLLVMTLPFTIAGLGVREGSLLIVLASFYVSAANAVAFSFLILGQELLVKLVGGSLEARDWFRRRKPRTPGRTKPTETLRLAVVEVGGVFERYYEPALRRTSRWKVVAVCDTSRARRETVARRLGASAYENLSALLKETSPDAVLIATSPASHAALAIEALDHRVPVLVEKPMAVDVGSAASIVSAARRTGAHLQVGFNRRFRESYREMRERLHEIPGTDAVDAVRFELVVDRSWDSSSDFRRGHEPGASVIDDVACHQLDLLEWLTGRTVERVRAEPMEEDGETVSYVAVLTGGLVAQCLAGRGPRYREIVEIRSGRQSWLVTPAGVRAVSGEGPHVLARGWMALEMFAGLAADKLLGRPNATARSFTTQLDDFASAVCHCWPSKTASPGNGPKLDAHPFNGADGESGLRTVLAARALDRSIADGGQWQVVRIGAGQFP